MGYTPDWLVPTQLGPSNPIGGYMPDWLEPIQTSQKEPAGLRDHFSALEPPKEADGIVDWVRSGFQGSATGFMLRGKMPEVQLGQEAPWYARGVTGLAGVVSDLPVMIAGGAAAAPAGGAIGGPVGAGVATMAGAFALPTAIRESYIQALTKGEITSAADFASRAGTVAWETFKSALVGGAAGGVSIATKAALLTRAGIPSSKAMELAAGGLDRIASKEAQVMERTLLESTGQKVLDVGQKATIRANAEAVALERMGVTRDIAMKTVEELSKRTTVAADLGAQTIAMTTAQSALEGRLPEPHEFLDAAIVIGGLHYANIGVRKLYKIYQYTGKRPMEVAADIRDNPNILLEISEASKEVRDNESRIFRAVEDRRELIRSAEEKAYRGETPTPEENAAARSGELKVDGGSAEFRRAIEILRIPEDQRTSSEKAYLDVFRRGEYGVDFKPGEIIRYATPEFVREEAQKKIDEIETKAANLAVEKKQYTAEIQKLLDEAKTAHEERVAFYRRSFDTNKDKVMLDKNLKGEGFRYAAEKRRITGELTAKERAAEEKRQAGWFKGKEVVAEGKDAVVDRVVFGKVRVKFADGTVKSFDPADVVARGLKPASDHLSMLSPEGKAEYEFLKANIDNPQALADRYGIGLTNMNRVGPIPKEIAASKEYQDIHQAIRATGAYADDAVSEAASRVMYAFADATARKMGMPLREWLDKYGARFISGEPTGAYVNQRGEYWNPVTERYESVGEVTKNADGTFSFTEAKTGDVFTFQTEREAYAAQQLKAMENRSFFQKGWIEIQPYEGEQAVNPLAPFVRMEGIEGAQGRLTRALEREKTVGGPSNPRVVLRAADGLKAAFGRITVNDWKDRVKTQLSQDELNQARAWYGSLHELMAKFFGEANAERYALAWLLSQQNVSPSGGMMNVLRAADIAAGLPVIKHPGLGGQKLVNAIRGEIPQEGYDAKLLDFVDSELQRKTRTVMGGDVRGGAPAVIDVWANRDVGKIDSTTLKWIKATFGDEVASKLQIDGDTIGETQYEYGSRFYNDLVAKLNKEGFDGGNWKTYEAQAVGWVAMQKLMGSTPEYPKDIFEKNIRRISLGLAPGEGSPISGLGEIQTEAAARVISKSAEATGVKIVSSYVASGAYLGARERAFQIDILGSPESVRDFAALVGSGLRQTEVLISRPLKSGKTQGVTLVEVDSTKLADPDAAEAFIAAVRAKLGENATIANGYQMVNINGSPALRIFKGTWNKVDNRVDWAGKWNSKEIEAFERAVEETAHERGIEVDRDIGQYDVTSEYNDWNTNRSGEAYRDSLKNRGRDVLSERISSDRELQILPHEVGEAPRSGRLSQSAPVWYSALARSVEGMNIPAEGLTAAEWKNLLVKPEEKRLSGVRDEKNKVVIGPDGKPVTIEKIIPAQSLLPKVKLQEIKDIGLLDWLDALTKYGEGKTILGGDKIPKEEIQRFLAQGGARMEFKDELLGEPIRKGHLEETPDMKAIRASEQVKTAGEWKALGGTEKFLIDTYFGDPIPNEEPIYFYYDRLGKFESLNGVLGFVRGERAESGTIAEWAKDPNVDWYFNAEAEVTKPTKYSQYKSIPGEGRNYREAFVTVPGKKIKRYISDQTVPGQGRVTYHIVEVDGKRHEFLMKEGADKFAAEQETASWKDGHPGYSGIDNPIVRMRWDEREVDGQKVMAVHELQPPTSGSFNEMPKTLQDRWLAIGLKRVIRYAAEKGFDKVVFSTGEQQVKLYESALRDRVDFIEWEKTPEGVHLAGFKGKRPVPFVELTELPEGYRIEQKSVTTAQHKYALQTENTRVAALVTEKAKAITADEIRDTAARKVENIEIIPEGQRSRQEWEIFHLYRDMYHHPERYLGLKFLFGERYEQVKNAEKLFIKQYLGKEKRARMTPEEEQAAKFYIDTLRVFVPDAFKNIDIKNRKQWTVFTEGRNIPEQIGASGTIGRGATEEAAKASALALINRARKKMQQGSDPPRKEVDTRDQGGAVKESDLAIAIGKVMADKIKNDPNQTGFIEGNDLVVDSIGVKKLYDVQIPALTEKILKDMGVGGKVGEVNIASKEFDVGEFGIPVEAQKTMQQPGFDITPALRERAMQGMPLYQGERGYYQPSDRTIGFLKDADPSTAIHEPAHFFLSTYFEISKEANAPLTVVKDTQTILDWFGLTREQWDRMTLDEQRPYHEQWARGFEKYVATNEAPTSALARVFEQFRKWILDVYQTLTKLNVEVPPEIKDVMDRMLKADEHPATEGVPEAYKPIVLADRGAEIIPGRRKMPVEPGLAAEAAAIVPYADAIPPGAGKAPENIHINYQYLNTPQDVKLALQRMAELDQANIQAKRGGVGGVETWASEKEKAIAYLNDIAGAEKGSMNALSELMDRNDVSLNVRMRSWRMLLVGAAEHSAKLRDTILRDAENATVEDQLAYLASLERMRMIQAEFLGQRAAVARALGAMRDVVGAFDPTKLYQGLTKAEIKARLEELMLQFGGKTALELAKLHKDMGTVRASNIFAEKALKAGTWEKVIEAWKAGLLSGPVTPMVNLFGTGSFMFMRPMVDAVASVFGAMRKDGTNPERVAAMEPIARLSGMLQGIKDGLKVAGEALVKDQGEIGKVESYRHAIEGNVGYWIRFPYRLMSAGDQLVQTMYVRGELMARAVRENAGKYDPRSTEFTQSVERMMSNPETMKDVRNEAIRFAFNQPFGEKGRAVQGLIQKWHLQWAIPFVRTPLNIAEEMIRMSPFAPMATAWRNAFLKGGVARDRALAEMALGSAIFALVMSYAMSQDELITGGGEPEPGKRRGKAGVWQPYSIRVGDTYYSYQRFQPVGTLIGMAADVAAVWDKLDKQDDIDKIPKMMSMAFANAITNQTFLQGLTNLVNAISDPTRFGERFAQQYAASMIPNIIAQPTAMLDDKAREINGMLDAVAARLPGFRGTVQEKIDYLGEAVPAKERLLGIMPIAVQPISGDQVRKEIARLAISIPVPPKKITVMRGTGRTGEIELTPEQRHIYATVSGEFARRVLPSVVADPKYQSIPKTAMGDLIKRKMIQRIFGAAHRFGTMAAVPPNQRTGVLLEALEQAQEQQAAEEL